MGDQPAVSLPVSPWRSGWAVALGVVLALVFGGTVWAAIARDTPPAAQLIIVHPSASLAGPPAGIETEQGLGADPSASPAPTEPTPTPTASPTPTATTPAPAPTPSSPATTSPPTRTPGVPTTPPAPPSAEITARYVLSSTWDRGFVANVDVSHVSGRVRTFDVRLTFPDNVVITVTGFWNATPSVTGSSLTFSGGPLDPQGTISFGFQAEKNRPSQVNPTSCTVNGRPCVGF
ncbi:cellulose binding domain-containing protein [Micromonospora sp. NBC_01813]|uniref:cellulose binding domain-containing protein n=1 Tax=Micromonospora sp. NBC_01813 TaxID=2975988 RepID=UPI002DD927EF|nr:cellulose binding domain-containing protein [Micromonospora sp. NBC_01813]WSA08470.1 cellulose-binding domain-containing protein [Micromonospora sp. NBC_01813]